MGKEENKLNFGAVAHGAAFVERSEETTAITSTSVSNTGSSDPLQQRRVIVQIKSGKVSGIVQQLPNGKKYYTFKGIPYAQPPVGELRFKPPQLLDKLPDDILDCSKDGPGCFTVDNYLPNDRMSESCLNLNVYTPAPLKGDDHNSKTNYNQPLPVMVWIHGGGFVGGSAQSSMYCPDHLVQQGTVVVTVNYRLGPLGFLCLPSVGIYGNMGLKDQRMSFRWVWENIGAFGGDPGNVTIFGWSAGGASVHLHYLSESSREYFHKAIAQSGTAFNQWVFQNNFESRARKLAELLGCQSNSKDDIIYDTLKNASPKELTELQYQVMTEQERSVLVNFPFTPVVEHAASIEPIIAHNPLRLIETRFDTVIPLVMGITSEEGAALAGHVISLMEHYKRTLPSQLVPFTLNAKQQEQKEKAFKDIKEFFFRGEILSPETVPIMVQILGDNANKFAGYLSAELHSRHQRSPLYFYVFSFMSELNKMRELGQTPDNCPGAVHGDELCYLFSSTFFNTESVQPANCASEYRRIMCKLWTNFAKHGSPTPDDTLGFQWSEVDKATAGGDDAEFQLNAIELKNDDIKMIDNPFAERFNFWKSLFAKFNLTHLNPLP